MNKEENKRFSDEEVKLVKRVAGVVTILLIGYYVSQIRLNVLQIKNIKKLK